MTSGFKARVLEAFAAVLRARVTAAEGELAVLDEAAAQETKSSAGDKYETAREMFTQARDLQRRRCDEARVQLDWIARQDPSQTRDRVGAGALVRTDGGWILLSPIPLSVEVEGVAVQGVSVQSPLGLGLKGAKAGDRPVFRDRPVEVLAVA